MGSSQVYRKSYTQDWRLAQKRPEQILNFYLWLTFRLLKAENEVVHSLAKNRRSVQVEPVCKDWEMMRMRMMITG